MKIAVKADGKDQNVSGSPHYDTVNVGEVDDHTVEITHKKGGKVTGTRKYTVSDDGQSLTREFTDVFESGRTMQGKDSWDRVGEPLANGNKITGTWKFRKVESASENMMTWTYKVTEDGLSMTEALGESYTAKFDGKDYPYKGDPGTTTVSLEKIDDNTIEETDKQMAR